MDCVESIGRHVVGEATCAADTTDEGEVFFRDVELREGLLNGREDGVVAASWAPSNEVIGLEVLSRQLFGGGGHG